MVPSGRGISRHEEASPLMVYKMG